MPTYEYRCEKCGHEFEEFQSITSRPIRKCPKCGKNAVHRLISAGAGFIFKGTGFYQTDYRSEGYKESAKKDAAPTATSAPASTGKPESKSGTESGSSAAAPKAPVAPAASEKSEPSQKASQKPAKSAAKSK